jgi:hypothetical protein
VENEEEYEINPPGSIFKKYWPLLGVIAILALSYLLLNPGPSQTSGPQTTATLTNSKSTKSMTAESTTTTNTLAFAAVVDPLTDLGEITSTTTTTSIKVSSASGNSQVIADCDKIADTYHREYCIIQYAYNYDPHACDLFRQRPDKHYECISDVAKVRNSSSYCDILQDVSPNFYRSMCKIAYSFFRSNTPYKDCSSIGQNNLRVYCQAVLNSNKSLCSQIDRSAEPWSISDECVKCASQTNKLKCCPYINQEGKISYLT